MIRQLKTFVGSMMKFEILSILPNRWNESRDLRAMLLTLSVTFGVSALKSTYGLSAANALLLSGFVAIVAVYWIPPLPKERYVRWILTNCVVLFGLYLFLFKIPSLFSGFISYRVAQFLCMSVYGICWWFLIRFKEKRFVANQMH